nr:unnamed protein product [Callosobruchus chinensis]
MKITKKDGASEGTSRLSKTKTGNGGGLLPPPPGGSSRLPAPPGSSPAGSPAHAPKDGIQNAGAAEWGEFTSANAGDQRLACFNQRWQIR